MCYFFSYSYSYSYSYSFFCFTTTPVFIPTPVLLLLILFLLLLILLLHQLLFPLLLFPPYPRLPGITAAPQSTTPRTWATPGLTSPSTYSGECYRLGQGEGDHPRHQDVLLKFLEITNCISFISVRSDPGLYFHIFSIYGHTVSIPYMDTQIHIFSKKVMIFANILKLC